MNAPGPYQPPPQSRGDQPPRSPAPTYRYRDLPEPPNATLIFILGLLGVMGVCFILGPIAWMMGSAERARVRAGMYRENGLLTAGYIMGVIASILMIIPLVIGLIWIVCVMLIGLGAAASSAGCAF